MLPSLQRRVLDLLTHQPLTVETLTGRVGDIPSRMAWRGSATVANPHAAVRHALLRLQRLGLAVHVLPTEPRGDHTWRRALDGELEPEPVVPPKKPHRDREAEEALLREACADDIAAVMDGWDVAAATARAEADALANARRLGNVDHVAEEIGSTELTNHVSVINFKLPPNFTFTPPQPRPTVSGVYEFTSRVTGVRYIGESWDCERRRDCGTTTSGECRNSKPCHKCTVSRRSGLPFPNEAYTHGWDSYDWTMLEVCDTEAQRKDRELFWIADRLNAGVELHCLKGAHRYAVPNLFRKTQDVDNPYIEVECRRLGCPCGAAAKQTLPAKKPRKKSRNLTDVELCQAVTMRAWGFKLRVIATVFDGITEQGVSHAINAVKRGKRRVA